MIDLRILIVRKLCMLVENDTYRNNAHLLDLFYMKNKYNAILFDFISIQKRRKRENYIVYKYFYIFFYKFKLNYMNGFKLFVYF